ncbi:MAG: GNAT family N-acetyltransferase [Candidatus Pristimantibacillus sp.]
MKTTREEGTAMETEIVQVTHNDTDLHALINKLDEDLFQRYPEDEVFALDFNDPDIKDIVFLVAYFAGVPVGCGAIRPLDDTYVELKRFYVDPTFRRQGIAAAILTNLETTANDRKFKYIRLEAGAPQPEALRFYMKHGYYAIDRYGEYVNCESSLCYEKKL